MAALRLALRVHDPSQMPAAVAAIANLAVSPAGPAIEIVLDVDAGTYTLGQVSVPAGLKLIIDAGGCPYSLASSSGPVLTLVSGDVAIRNAAFSSTADASTVLVQGGQLHVRRSTIEETTAGSRAAIEITGGLVDLGILWDGPGANRGYNTVHVHGPGVLIRNTGPNNVLAGGNRFLVDGQELGGTSRSRT